MLSEEEKIKKSAVYMIMSTNDHEKLDSYIDMNDPLIRLYSKKLAVILCGKHNGKLNETALNICSDRQIVTSILNANIDKDRLKKLLEIEINAKSGIQTDLRNLIHLDYAKSEDIRKIMLKMEEDLKNNKDNINELKTKIDNLKLSIEELKENERLLNSRSYINVHAIPINGSNTIQTPFVKNVEQFNDTFQSPQNILEVVNAIPLRDNITKLRETINENHLNENNSNIMLNKEIIYNGDFRVIQVLKDNDDYIIKIGSHIIKHISNTIINPTYIFRLSITKYIIFNKNSDVVKVKMYNQHYENLGQFFSNDYENLSPFPVAISLSALETFYDGSNKIFKFNYDITVVETDNRTKFKIISPSHPGQEQIITYENLLNSFEQKLYYSLNGILIKFEIDNDKISIEIISGEDGDDNIDNTFPIPLV